MGPKRKKQIRNDFYFFMQDQKTRLMRGGSGGNLPMDEVAEICHPLWTQMDGKERER